ncbi:S-layer homology domain-containing protein [Aneurinibacillus tyrosinisolvens]|uniref:S-layer homology domain-containing protein n=1 Tax=Aneurinibacillus tyrosinisolvens TaxID=1443435 RepID=UPI00063FA75F|nr:S-layer homology domain-containing protein [Aneurinibacillus tyrosinisolvens]
MKRVKRSFIPLTLAGILAVSGVSYPVGVKADSTTAVKSSFSDVSDSYWAAQPIVKMGLRDVVAGYNDGTFRPDEKVTQMEALAMVIRNMGLKAEADSYKATGNLAYNVPDWAKSTVAFAVSKGLIKPEEKRFAPAETATRSWVAQLMIRMINKEQEVSKAAAENTVKFTDDNSFPTWVKDYINAAASYGLISGFSEGNGLSFKPELEVTRAQMVAFLSRSEKYLDVESDRSHIGTLQSLASGTLTIKGKKDGTAYTYEINSGTKFYDGTKKITKEEVKANSQLLVIALNNKAYYVEAIDQAAANTIVDGTIEKVYEEAQSVIVKDKDGKLTTYQVDSTTTLGTSSATIKSINELVKGDEIRITIAPGGKVVSLTRTSESKDKSLEGTVYDIDQQAKLLTIKTSGSKLEAFNYDDATFVEYKNKRFPNIGDLIQGDSVKLELANGIISKIIVNVAENEVNSGTIKAVNVADQFITIQGQDGKLQVYRVDNSTAISVGETTGLSLSDLVIGDKIDIKVQNETVSSITVKNRTVVNPTEPNDNLKNGTIFAVDATNRVISLKNASGELTAAYELSTNAELIMDGKSNPGLADLKKDMNVSFQLDQDNKIIYINADNRIKGQITRINPDNRLLTVKLESGETKVYVVDKDVSVVIFDSKGEDLEDLRNDDKVSMKLSGTKVIDIDVERTFVYRVTEVYDYSIRGEDDKGNSRIFNTYGQVSLKVPGVSYPKASDFKKGDVIKVTYSGDTLKAVTVVPSVNGQVLSINPDNNTIKVKDYNGVTNEITAATGSTIKISDRQYTSLSALKVGDRVQVAESSNGTKSILVMDKIETTFNELDKYGDRVYTPKGSYYLPADLFARQPNLNTMLKGLKKDDKIVLYMSNSKVYDIAKVD